MSTIFFNHEVYACMPFELYRHNGSVYEFLEDLKSVDIPICFLGPNGSGKRQLIEILKKRVAGVTFVPYPTGGIKAYDVLELWLKPFPAWDIISYLHGLFKDRGIEFDDKALLTLYAYSNRDVLKFFQLVGTLITSGEKVIDQKSITKGIGDIFSINEIVKCLLDRKLLKAYSLSNILCEKIGLESFVVWLYEFLGTVIKTEMMSMYANVPLTDVYRGVGLFIKEKQPLFMLKTLFFDYLYSIKSIAPALSFSSLVPDNKQVINMSVSDIFNSI